MLSGTEWFNDPTYIIPIAVGGGLAIVTFVITLGCICLCVCCGWCRCQRTREVRIEVTRDGHSVESSPLLGNRREEQRTANRLQLLEATMHLQDRRPEFTLVKPVFFIGRAHKQYYLLSHSSSRGQYLLSVVDEYRSDLVHERTLQCSITSERERVAAETFLRLFQTQLTHRIAPPLHVSFSSTSKRMFVIREVCPKGSLFDFVVGCTPLSPPSSKGTRGHVLQEQIVRIFGRQILEGVWSLRKVGCRVPQLSSHNVLIRKDSTNTSRETPFQCVLTDIENVFMGVPPQPAESMVFHNPVIRRFNIEREVLAFGRLLYFMSKGYELQNPTLTDFTEIESDQLRLILCSIFPKRKKKGSRLPTIEDLLNDPYFSSTLDCPLQELQIPRGIRHDLKRLFQRVHRQYENEVDPQLASTGVFRE